ncbi:c-type cytochrome [Oxalobacteraceae bacterium OM1]|nr:c-type cytochrome [Oxalobacteraceae bacterium OM1]
MLAGALAVSIAFPAAADKPVFKSPIDNAPIDTPLKPGEPETPALKQFKETGKNSYRNDAVAVKQGKELYEQWCVACHNTDASGKIGPPLVGGKYTYDQTATDPGMFAIIYGGASGAMQAFSKREMTQDEMLKIIAYVRSLDQKK